MPTSAPPRRRGILDELVERQVDMRAVGLLRAAMGVIVVRHLWPELRADVVAVERFHVPWWPWLPVPDPAMYRTLLWVGAAAGVAMALGLVSRAATVVALVTVSYLQFVDMTSFAHNRGFLIWLLAGLALLPTGRSFSLDARLARRPPGSEVGPFWPVFLLRAVVASVYFTSGFTKLLNPDWRSGLVLWDRVQRHAHLIPFDGWIHDAVTSRLFHHLLSPVAITVELFLAVALWLGRTRLAAVWVALVFHASIEVVASVQTFSYSAIAALLLWITPATRDRAVLAAPARLRGAIARLDWLHRFHVAAPPPEGGDRVTVVVDRDGVTCTGRAAALLVLSRLPLLFPVAAPVYGIHRVRQALGRGVP